MSILSNGKGNKQIPPQVSYKEVRDNWDNIKWGGATVEVSREEYENMYPPYPDHPEYTEGDIVMIEGREFTVKEWPTV